MTIRQLQYLIALAQEQHFGRAAEVCFVSQPAFSDGIRKLEVELGLPLIHRKGHVFGGLTPEAEALLARAKRILAEYQGLRLQAEDLQTGLSGHIRIGSVPSASTTISKLVTTFARVCPDAQVSLNTKLTVEQSLQKLRDFELDIALISAKITDSDMEYYPLYRERMVMVGTFKCLQSYPSDSIDWVEAANYPLCALSHWVPWRQKIDQAFLQADCQPKIMIDTDSVASLYTLIGDGIHAAIVPDTWVLDIPMAENCRTITLTNPGVELDMYLVRLKAKPLRPLVEKFETEIIHLFKNK